MESVEIERAVGPFTTRNVHEWSSLDQMSGLIEHARVHTDHWTASTSNSSHHFGKVVDSRSRELANGGKEQQQQTKQLEMFQAQIPGGSVQVIRSSTSSTWQTHHKMTLNPLDISLQKTKAWIGRSGSIGGRRPPSRTRSIVGSKAEERFDQLEINTVPTELTTSSTGETVEKRKEKDLEVAIDKTLQEPVNSNRDRDNHSDELSLKTNNYKQNSTVRELISGSTAPRSHFSITRQKSCSSENLNYLDEDDKTNSNHITWNRSSSVRRSLQFPSKSSTSTKDNIICPQRKSVSEIRKEIEERKQLISYALPEKDLGLEDENIDTHLKDRSRLLDVGSHKTRQTVITAESLKDVRGRLRKLSSNESKMLKDDIVDDCTDNKIESDQGQLSESPKKLYLFGMEVKLRHLQEQTTMDSNKSVTNGDSHKWHNERKSYAFEEGANRNNNITSCGKKIIEPSTADGGIFISSATFPSAPNIHIVKPPKAESSIHTTHNIVIKPYKDHEPNSIARNAVVQTGRKTIVNVTRNGNDSNCNNRLKNGGRSMQQEKRPKDPDTWKISDSEKCLQEKSQSQQFSKPITISIPVQQNSEFDLTDPKRLLLKQTDSLRGSDNIEESNTINENGINSYSQLIFGRDIGQKNSLDNGLNSENIPWRTGRTKTLSNFFDSEFKRHSIAVDKAKYLKPSQSFRSNYGFDNQDFGTNHNLYDSNEKLINSTSESDHEMNSNDKRHKKVEFSKTEVHFAAEPGRFNIVETDGKPPPSNNYGRRRKTKTDASKLTGQPVIRFGDIPDEHLLFKTNETILLNETLSTPPQLASQKSLALHNSEKDYNVPAVSETTTFQTKLLNTKPPYKIDIGEPKLEQKSSNENSSLKSRSIIHFKSQNSYLVGESSDHSNQDETWRVKLKLNSENGTSQWQPEEPKGISQNSKESPSLSKETEFQKMLRSLRMTEKKPADIFGERTLLQPCSTAAENGLEVRIASSSVTPDNRRASWSFFERVRHSDNAKGFSTKVNFGPQQPTLIDSPAVSCHSSGMPIKSKLIQEYKHSSDSTQGSSEHEPTSASRLFKRQAEDVTMTTHRLPFSSYDKGLQTHLAQALQTHKLTDNSHRTPTVELNSVKSNSDEFKIVYRTERSSDTDEGLKLSSLLGKECAQQERFAKKTNNAITISDPQLTLRDYNLTSHHHSRDHSDLERSTKNTLCNRNNRELSCSTTNQISRKESSKTVNSLAKTPTDLVHNSLNKNNQLISASKSCSIQAHNKLNTVNSTNPSTSKLEEKTNLNGKKNERYKTEDRLKRRDKKLTTVDSGRDGWLNISKDIQPRNKSEPIIKKATMKKELTTKTSNSNGARTSKERKGSTTEKKHETYEDLSDARERESNISDELMKAADQILLAVNGYTDDDSIITSSSNEGHSKKETRSLRTLRTIYEPTIKQSNTNKNKTKQHIRSTRSTDLRMESISKKKEGRKVSSLSSRESGPESHSSSKDRRMHRATRLMQRASSRENMLQGTASSSEDLGSGSDTAMRNKRVYRKPRLKHRCSRQEKSTDTTKTGTKLRTD